MPSDLAGPVSTTVTVAWGSRALRLCRRPLALSLVTWIWRAREGDRERQRERDTQKEREGERERERDTEKEKKRERERERERDVYPTLQKLLFNMLGNIKCFIVISTKHLR